MVLFGRQAGPVRPCACRCHSLRWRCDSRGIGPVAGRPNTGVLESHESAAQVDIEGAAIVAVWKLLLRRDRRGKLCVGCTLVMAWSHCASAEFWSNHKIPQAPGEAA